MRRHGISADGEVTVAPFVGVFRTDEDLLILGAGGNAKVVAETAIACGLLLVLSFFATVVLALLSTPCPGLASDWSSFIFFAIGMSYEVPGCFSGHW